MHEGGGRWVGSNKLVELKKNVDLLHVYTLEWYFKKCFVHNFV